MQAEQHRFSGRRAVVTGGASGIGLAVAERLRSEGARVCVWDRTSVSSDPDQDQVQTIQLDITDFPAVEKAAKRTVEMLGGIDIRVCSAGGAGPNATTWNY